MTDVSPETNLFAKKEEIANVVVSRKRKLCELYAVASYIGPVPSAQPTEILPGEAAFLAANDILKGLYFDESTLPARPASLFTLHTSFGIHAQGTSSQTSISSLPSYSNVDQNGNSNRAPVEVQEQSIGLPQGNVSASESGAGWNEDETSALQDLDGRIRKSSRSDGTPSLLPNAHPHASPRDGPLSNGSLRSSYDRIDGDRSPSLQGSLEKTHIISTVESLDGSPGVEPARAMPLSSEDVAHLSRSAVMHLGPERDRPAKTMHLPAKENQERHVRALEGSQETSKRRAGDEDGKAQSGLPGSAEPRSSPSSTTCAYSANTPGLNGASPDTSPNEEIPHDAAKPFNLKIPRDPALSDEQRLAKVEHDNLLKSQMNLARADAFSQTPSDPDAQLRLEEQQAARGPTLITNDSPTITDQVVQFDGKSPLTKEATELVQDIVEDEEDVVVGVPTPRNKAVSYDPRSTPPSDAAHVSTSTTDSMGLESNPMGEDQSNVKILKADHKKQRFSSPNGYTPLAPIRTDMLANSQSMRATERTNQSPQTVREKDFEALQGPEKLCSGRDGDTAMQDDTIVESRTKTATSVNSVPPPTPVQSPPERMTTRVSSGAMRHKSVSEILGETPKPSHSQAPKSLSERTPITANRSEAMNKPPTPISEDIEPQLPFAILRNGERREKGRSKLSTVVFAKQQHQNKSDLSSMSGRNASSVSQACEDDRDYFYPLFAQTASQPRAPHLSKLLETARKTISTADLYVNLHEQQDCRILRRIYQLQYANRWSLRQMERAVEPSRPKVHWDSLLDEMKWLQTDFREERKWKIAAAKNLADWCAEWVASSPKTRSSLQIKAKPTPRALITSPISQRVEAFKAPSPLGTINTTLTNIEAIRKGAASLEPHIALGSAGIFSLGPADITFEVKKTISSDRILAELPIYKPMVEASNIHWPQPEPSLDSSWKTSVLPITKYITGKIVTREEGPPRKRSRYTYDDEDEQRLANFSTDHEDTVMEEKMSMEPSLFLLPPEQHNVALFDPDNRHIRDRIHNSHAFRPPTESGMPSQSFYEHRISSQWIWSEDARLRRVVHEYLYNWSMISCVMSLQSKFSSGAERRTPWECFERWIALEGLPQEMQKTQYFRTYHSRIDAAQRIVAAQQQAVSQASTNGPPLTPLRRRTTLPVKVDRRRNNKHLALIDAMRKLAKKRETTLSKQQHSAAMAATRKANEAPQPRNPVQTPQEFSRLKHDREQKMQKAAEAYRQSVIQQQRIAIQQQQQRSGQQAGQQHTLPNGAGQQPRNSTPSTTNTASPAVGSSITKANHQPGVPTPGRPPTSLQPLSNGLPNQQSAALLSGVHSNVQMGVKGVPQAQMQSSAQSQQRPPPQMGPDNMRIIMEANRVQQEQQRFLSQQRHQPHAPHFSGQQTHHSQAGPSASPNMNHANGAPSHNPAMLAAMHAANINGSGNPSANGMNHNGGSSSSPQMSQVHSNQPQHLSSGHVPAVTSISHQLKARNPQMSPEQITKLTNDHLHQQYRDSITQAAMSAAAGGSSTSSNVNNAANQHAHQQNQQQPGIHNGGNNSGQLNYAQMMRVQQANQSRGGGGGGGNLSARPPSRSSTPQNRARSGSAQAGQVQQGQIQSPRPPQAQMAAGQ